MVPNWETNENFQSSDASQIHGMMLGYSDSDEITDEEVRQLNLQDAAHTYMMEQMPRIPLLQFYYRILNPHLNWVKLKIDTSQMDKIPG